MVAINKVFSALFSGGIKGHFGQGAEDVLVRKLFPRTKKDGVYLDIGAYHPFKHSNTAWFWMKGWRGYNIDANPNTIKLFEKHRPKDANFWTAIIPGADYDNGTRHVSLMLPNRLDYASGISATGTVSAEVGDERGFSSTQQVPAISIAILIEQNNIKDVDYLNIDIEGYDEAILSEIDFSVISPTVVTIEDYSDSFAELVNSRISKLMERNGYDLVGRAGITSIFLKKP